MAQPRTRKSLVSFTGGEMTPKLDARADTEKYQNGCRQLQNLVLMPQGGVTRRRGFQFVASAKYDYPNHSVRMIRFQFNHGDTMVIEAGTYYFRFYRNGAQVLASPGVPYEIVTTYTSTDVFNLQFAQIEDVMFLTAPLFPVMKLTRLADNNWTFAAMTFGGAVDGVAPMLDMNVGATTITPSNTTGAGVTLTASAALFDARHVGAYFSIGYVRPAAETGGDLTADGSTPAISILGDWQFFTYGTWAGTVTIERSTDGGTTWLAVRTYTTDKDANIVDNGTQATVSALYRVTGLNLSASGTPNPRGVLRCSNAAVDGLVKITAVADSTHATCTVLNALLLSTTGTTAWVTTHGYVVGDRVSHAGLYYICQVAHTSGTFATDLAAFKWLAQAVATTRWAEGAFSDLRGYPTAVAFFQQRLWFAGTSWEPQKFWGSEVGGYSNFALGVNATDPVAFTLASEERNQILWMIGQTKLVLGTSGGVWACYGDELEGPISAASPPIVAKQNNLAMQYSRPVMVDKAILAIQQAGRKVREMVFDRYQGQYTGDDLSVMSDHITAGGMDTPAYQQARDNILWGVTGYGALVGMTYEKSQNVIAWHRHNTGANGTDIFESVETVYGQIDDQLWVSVLRNINGTWKRFIEYCEGYYSPTVDQLWQNNATITPIACATAAASASPVGTGYTEIPVELGTGTGTVALTFDCYSVPDRIVVEYDGAVVIDTGYRGDASFNAMLEAIGLPDVSGAGGGSSSFAKSAAQPTRAVVKVYSPLWNSWNDDWTFTLGCPGGGTPPAPPVPYLFKGAIYEECFVDSAVTYSGVPTTSITGLDHLEGMAVDVLADGNWIKGKTVASGAITLAVAASIVHVGLHYDAILQPMRIDTDPAAGGTQGLMKRVSKLIFRLLDTAGVGVATVANATPVSVPLPATITGGVLLTGDVEVDYAADYDNDATFIAQSQGPYPLTILGVVVKYQVSET